MDEPTKVLLLVEVPRTNDKKELAAEQMFAAIHGILKPRRRRWGLGNSPSQEYISFEIASIGQRIHFYVHLPLELKDFVEGQIYAQYSTAQIFVVDQDYCQLTDQTAVVGATEIELNNHESIPITTFKNFDVDPLSGITAALARLETDEQIWIQILARPIDDGWHKNSQRHINRIETGGLSGLASIFANDDQAASKPRLTDRDSSRIQAIKQKSTKLGYQVKIRVLYLGQTTATANLRIQAVVGAFKQFNTTDLNGFRHRPIRFNSDRVRLYQQRQFKEAGFVLNIEELASVFHLPHTSVDTPNIVWASSKTAEPPATIPLEGQHPATDISLFGLSNFRSSDQVFGCLRSDRGRHIYVIGQTGTGKSGLLELLSLSDINFNQGYGIVDPHGDFAVNNLRAIPADRIADVVYFNPADVDYPIGFNPLEVTDVRQRVQVASELVGVLKRMFDSWGPRLEYILRNTILALLDTPETTMLDITRMLTDKKFRARIVANLDDIVVKNFWQAEFNSWDHKLQTEAVAPVLNKVGAFTTNPIVRNIIGQPKGRFNIRRIMDQGKILVLNLSRGLIGEDNANILGAMIITKIQLAAMSRADIDRIEDRRPFYLYVDEFQNFATDSFAVILSEARKYGLYLTLANQYISQMSPEVRGAVFGNVGSIVSFRVSPDDAPFLEKYFSPQFTTQDIIQLANRNFVATLTIAGEKATSFSGRTLDIKRPETDQIEAILEQSRQNYSRPKAEVEALIKQNAGQYQDQVQTNQPAGGGPAKRKKSRSGRSGQSGPALSKPMSDNIALAALRQSLTGSNQNQPESQKPDRPDQPKPASGRQPPKNQPAKSKPPTG